MIRTEAGPDRAPVMRAGEWLALRRLRPRHPQTVRFTAQARWRAACAPTIGRKQRLGPVDRWPEALRSTVSTCLDCAFPIVLWWGPELSILYNDEYIDFLGEAKHPEALGRPGADVWAEIWDVIEPMLSQVLTQESPPARATFSSTSTEATPKRPTSRSRTARSTWKTGRWAACSAPSSKPPTR